VDVYRTARFPRKISKAVIRIPLRKTYAAPFSNNERNPENNTLNFIETEKNDDEIPQEELA